MGIFGFETARWQTAQRLCSGALSTSTRVFLSYKVIILNGLDLVILIESDLKRKSKASFILHSLVRRPIRTGSSSCSFFTND